VKLLERKQLLGLSEVLPNGYPKQGGVIVVRNDGKSAPASKSRKRRQKKYPIIPWYRR